MKFFEKKKVQKRHKKINKTEALFSLFMRLFSEVTFVTVSFIMYWKKKGGKSERVNAAPQRDRKRSKRRKSARTKNTNKIGGKKRRTRESKNECRVNERLNECDEERTKKKDGRRIRRVLERDVL